MQTRTDPVTRSWIPFTLTALALAVAGCGDDSTPTGIGGPALPRPSLVTIGTTPTITHSVVNDGPGTQIDAHISGSLVAYTSDPDGTANRIRYHDLATGADAVVPHALEGDDFLPDISGNKVVFVRVNFTSSIYAYEIGAAGAVELAPSAVATRRAPAIGGNTVAWQDFGFRAAAFESEIVVHDLATGSTTRLTDDALFDRSTAVSPDGNIIVWVKCQTNGRSCDIWKAVKNAGVWTSSAVTGAEGEEDAPDTDGEIVTYASNRSGVTDITAEYDIYWRPLAGGTEQGITLTLPGSHRNPAIANGVITFQSNPSHTDPNSNWDLWSYDTATDIAFRLTTTSSVSETLSDVWVTPTGLIRVVYTAAEHGTSDTDVHALSFQRSALAQYDFTGFFQPVENGPAVNKAKAGSAVPVKFSLGGDQGLDIFAEGHPVSQAGTCDLSAGDVIEETATAGGSSLSYDPVTDQYAYVWKTEKAWAGTCRQLVVGLNDGTTHTSWFNFVK